MRISSLTFFTSSLSSMQNQQSALSRLNQQIATGQKYLAPKDDPIAVSRAMALSDRIEMRRQYLSNQDKADIQLKYEGTLLEEMRKTLTNVQSLLTGVAPSMDLLTNRERISELISAAYDQLKELANSQNSDGTYVFSGFETSFAVSTTLPYEHAKVAPDDDADPDTAATSGLTTYNGTAYPGGSRQVEIEQGRQIPTNHTLDNIFQPGVAGEDLLQALDQIAIDLRETTVTSAEIRSAFDVVTNAISGVQGLQTVIAGALSQLGDARNTSKAILNADEQTLAGITQVDQAAAIVELQMRQTSLEAAQRSFARVSGLSLFNYLG